MGYEAGEKDCFDFVCEAKGVLGLYFLVLGPVDEVPFYILPFGGKAGDADGFGVGPMLEVGEYVEVVA